MIFKLDRPKPVLPSSYFWTWDASTNWMLDDPGIVNYGCANTYLKRPETYVEDYKRLTDLCAGLDIPGFIIWGFLRDAHGGVEAAKKVASYAKEKGVALMPGFGTSYYGGAYYEGDHPYNLATYIKNHPGSEFVFEEANAWVPDGLTACPSYPGFQDWLCEGINWLFDNFDIGGVNIENGDLMVCSCPACKARHDKRFDGVPDFWEHQFFGYDRPINAIRNHLKDKLVTYATYVGFLPAEDASQAGMANCTDNSMFCKDPKIFDLLPEDAIVQWTLTEMVLAKPLPLSAYLKDGAPDAAFDNPTWPRDLKPLGKRTVGFLHNGSQWKNDTRYTVCISTIKEACLRAYRAGMEGISIHGELSSEHIPMALNYLAYSHFIHWPEDNLFEFAQKTLAPVLGSEEQAEDYIRLLCQWDEGKVDMEYEAGVKAKYFGVKNIREMYMHVKDVDSSQKLRFWVWLFDIIEGHKDRETVSFI